MVASRVAHRVRAALFIAALTSACLGLGTGLALSDAPEQEPPPRPPWVDETGRVIPDKVPARFQRMNSDGTPMLNSSGEPVYIEMNELPSDLPSIPGSFTPGTGLLEEGVEIAPISP